MEESTQPRTEPTDTVRLRIDLAYDGTHFHGWAAQPGLRTVEGVLTEALHTVTRTPVSLTVAGRTDSGVHAAHQVVHVDLPREVWLSLPGRSERDPGQALCARLAGVLAREAQTAQVSAPRGMSDVVVRAARLAPPGFDARFSALSRRYMYRLADDRTQLSPLRRFDVLRVPGVLDLEAINEAMVPLLGEHEFLGYCKPREGATTIRTLTRVSWVRQEAQGLISVDVRADAFCHSMVRSLIGAGITVGSGRKGRDWPAQILAAASRAQAAPVAPPHGLTLEEVTYPAEHLMAAQAQASRVLRTLEE